MYPGSVFLHGILRQRAPIIVPEHVIPRNRNVSGMRHLPVTMRVLQRDLSTHLQLVHRRVMCILSVLERLGRQRHLIFPLWVLRLALLCRRHHFVMLQ